MNFCQARQPAMSQADPAVSERPPYEPWSAFDIVGATPFSIGVLSEFHDVTQEAHGRRRWFETSGMDLTVWYDDAETISGFQLGYEAQGQSWALTWRAGQGFHHDLVHTGDTTPFKNQTPILEPKGVAPWPELIREFENQSSAIEPPLRAFVLTRLRRGKPENLI